MDKIKTPNSDTTSRIHKPVIPETFQRKEFKSFHEKYQEDLAKRQPKKFKGYGVDPAMDSLIVDSERYDNAFKNKNDEINKYKIPYIKDKEIMLTKGRYNTGKISTNLLDSIYDGAKRTNTPLSTALGLAGRESTLGIGRDFKENNPVTGTALYSNWNQVQTVHLNSRELGRKHNLYKKYLNKIKLNDSELAEYKKLYDLEKKDIASYKPITENPIDNALKYYKTGKYNPKDPRHSSMVEEDGKVILSDPAIRKWLKTKK